MKKYNKLQVRALAVLTALQMLFTPSTEVYADPPAENAVDTGENSSYTAGSTKEAG